MKKIKFFVSFICLTFLTVFFVAKLSAAEVREIGTMSTNDPTNITVSNALAGGTGKVSYVNAVETGADAADSYLIFPVSNFVNRNNDTTFISIKYSQNGISQMGMHIGYTYNGVSETSYVANMLSGWNVTNIPYSDAGYNIVTAKIGSYFYDAEKTSDSMLPETATIDSIVIKLTAEAGATFEVLEMAVTEDGNHGFTVPLGKFEVGDMTVPSSATVEKNAEGEQVVKYETSPGWSTFDMMVNNYDFNLNILELRFTSSEEVQICVEVNGNIDWSLAHKSYAGGSEQIQLIDVSSYNLPANFKISLYIDAQVSVSSEKTITFHSISFKTPEPEPEGMYLGEPSGHGMACMKAGDEWNISYNTDSPSWRNITIDVNKHEIEYDVIVLRMHLTEGTNFGVRALYEGEAENTEHYDFRSTYHQSSIITATGDYEFVFFALEADKVGKVLLGIELYFDTPTDVTVNTGDVTAKLYSYELLKSSELVLDELEFTVADLVVDYTGQIVLPEVTCAENVSFKFEFNQTLSETETSSWTGDIPTNAGEYNVRVTFTGNLKYGIKSVMAKLTINKVKATVNVDDVTVDSNTRVVTVKEGIVASLSPEFIDDEEYNIVNGSVVAYGSVIYYKVAENNNYYESDVISLTVTRPITPEPTPEETTPEETTPNVTTPEETTPEETTPDATTPDVTTPNVTTPATTKPTEKPKKSSKGCGGSIVGSLFATFAVLGTLVVIRNKKREF